MSCTFKRNQFTFCFTSKGKQDKNVPIHIGNKKIKTQLRTLANSFISFLYTEVNQNCNEQ